MEPTPMSLGDADEETTAAFQKALAAFKRRCSERSLRSFEQKSISQLKRDIIIIQRDQERLRSMQNLRRIENFVLRMEEFSKVLRDMVDTELYVSYVWGAMQFLLQQASSTMLEGFDGLLDAYEKLGEEMPNLKGLQALFTRYTGMRKCLCALYADIMDFHAGAYQCFTEFPERGRKKIFKSAWADFGHRITTLAHNFAAYSRLVDHGRRLLMQDGQGQYASQLSSQSMGILSGSVATAEGELANIARQAKDAETKRHVEQVNNVLGWFSASSNDPNPAEEIHSERCDVRDAHPGTCEWIDKNDAVSNWMKVDTPAHSMLWINGNMGAGKSTLASHLIDECKINTPLSASFKTVYFYCKAKEPALSTHIGMFRGLLYQQLLCIRDKERFRHLIAYCHDKKDQSGQNQQLNTEDKAKTLLDLFFDVIPNQYIIVDGLDECEKPEIKQCLALLTSVVSRQDRIDPGGLRLLIVSRDIPEIKKHLTADGATANTVKILPQDNEEAILTYVKQRIKQFPAGLKLKSHEEERIKDLTCSKAKGAQGMFLFAELVMDNLEQSDSKETLLQEIEKRRFPQNLNQAYERIIDRIQKSHSPHRWEKAKQIFGWLICAGRILRWHEIQAIVSIERHEQSVEFKRKKFITDLNELCGTLVHVKPGSKVELIHHTAHEFILNKSQFINKVEVQFDLATLCMQYLTFPCFEKGLDVRTRRSFAQEGFYAFQDYAVSRWFYHISEVVKISGHLIAVDKPKADKFAGILDEFMTRYQDSIDTYTYSTDAPPSSSSPSSTRRSPDMKEVEENAMKECESLKDVAFYEMLVHLWVHIAKYEKENIDDRNKPSIEAMERTLMDNRKAIETLVAGASGEAAKELAEYYGKNVYKCPRTRCDYFYEGFESERKRKTHMDRHERPFECTAPGCHMGGAGFISNKDLERHRKNYHATGTGADEPAPFPQPNRKKHHEARFTCNICNQRFTRKINLTGHTRSHFGERPYGCQTCGKKFTRINDMRRHERLHLRR